MINCIVAVVIGSVVDISVAVIGKVFTLAAASIERDEPVVEVSFVGTGIGTGIFFVVVEPLLSVGIPVVVTFSTICSVVTEEVFCS